VLRPLALTRVRNSALVRRIEGDLSSGGRSLARGGEHTTATAPRSLRKRFDAVRKRVEVAHRRFLIRSLSRATQRRRAAPEWHARPHDVLFLRPDRVGDMIISTGLLRAIATSHETIRLHVLATPANAAVLEQNPHVASVVVFHRRSRPWTWPRFVRDVRRARYDVVVDCMVFSPSLTLLLLMLATGAPDRVGIGGRANDAVYSLPVTPADRGRHHIEQLGALAAAFGVDVATFDWQPEIFLSPAEREAAQRLWQQTSDGRRAAEDGGPRLLINVSAGKERCRWPAERYVAVLEATLARHPGLHVLLVGMPRDAGGLRDIAAATGCATASPGLRDTLALVESADLLLTPDTGLVHAASAFRTPVVAMYHRGAAAHWGPYRTRARIVSSADRMLRSLPAAPVVAAVDELLGTLASELPASPGGAAAGEQSRRERSPSAG
jgi:ADP-heptose:LPS heptosyltransferase